jgi:uncharacterized protein
LANRADLEEESLVRAVIGVTHRGQISLVGPFGVGKTTAVRTISDTDVVETEAQSTAAMMSSGRHLKSSSTVGLEYGEWRAPDGARLAVVGTPGQARFDDVRRSAMPRSTAVVLLLFGHHDEAPLDAELWTRFILEEGVPARKLAVAVTRLDAGDPGALDPFREAVHRHAGDHVPVLAADPRSRADVEAVLVAATRGGAVRGATS